MPPTHPPTPRPPHWAKTHGEVKKGKGCWRPCGRHTRLPMPVLFLLRPLPLQERNQADEAGESFVNPRIDGVRLDAAAMKVRRMNLRRCRGGASGG